MTLRGPLLLDSTHHTEDFDCGKPNLDDWLKRRGLANQRTGASRTWVVLDDDNRVVAYYASAIASIVRTAATKRAARDQPDDIPALLLARLAVDHRHHGQGLAGALLKHFLLKAVEVADIVGARVVLVHAKDEEAKHFYLHHDFLPSPLDELTLMRPITDLRWAPRRLLRPVGRPTPSTRSRSTKTARGAPPIEASDDEPF